MASGNVKISFAGLSSVILPGLLWGSGTAQLLEALGEACVSACIFVVEKRIGALSLLCFSKGVEGTAA